MSIRLPKQAQSLRPLFDVHLEALPCRLNFQIGINPTVEDARSHQAEDGQHLGSKTELASSKSTISRSEIPLVGRCTMTCRNKRVACLLLYGNEKYFSSGWALDVLESTGGDERQSFFDIALKLMVTVYDYPKPTVCAVTGMCPGYALDVANFADITIASKNAAFGNSQVKYGLNPTTHPMFKKMGVQRAKSLIFTEDPMGAEEVSSDTQPRKYMPVIGISEREWCVCVCMCVADLPTL